MCMMVSDVGDVYVSDFVECVELVFGYGVWGVCAYYAEMTVYDLVWVM